MPQRHDSSLTTPQDAFERERLANVHPASWNNPKPAGCYKRSSHLLQQPPKPSLLPEWQNLPW